MSKKLWTPEKRQRYFREQKPIELPKRVTPKRSRQRIIGSAAKPVEVQWWDDEEV
jgi:hypothetical protein